MDPSLKDEVSETLVTPLSSAPDLASKALTGWRAWCMIGAITGSTFLNVYIYGALTVAVPSIGRDLNFTQPDLPWPVQAFNLTYGCFLLLAGRLADKYGRRNIFMMGTGWYTLLSIPPIFCPEPISFISLMALLGIGAAMMTSSGIGIVGGTLEGKLKNRAIAIVGGGQGIGFGLGLVSAGFFCDLHRGWRWIFVLQAGLGAIFMLLAFASVPAEGQRYDRALDLPGASLCVTSLLLLTFSLSHSQNVGWQVPYIPVLFVLSLILLATFIYWEYISEKRGNSVLLNVRMFKDKKLCAFFTLMFSMWWNFNVLQYLSTVYFQNVQGLSPVQTAIRFIPEAIADFVVNVSTGWWVEHIPAQWLNLFGIATSMTASVLFAIINPAVSFWQNAFWVTVLMTGADTIYTVGNLYVLTSMDAKSQALAGGLFLTFTRLATSTGLAVSSAVATAVSQHSPLARNLLRGYHAAGWVCFAMSCVGLAVNVGALWMLGMLVPVERKEL
ncbi:MFS general substrate transporter [Neolentinus lepideus HHB14362 ss-1]|uniref:MFS general substrate transporter n=1 Tax=Neolentinus lepideus HHB14362 ss-1 TaxID=1314782 RepID=A0A165MEQ9_9AGAM|nr:MFS general substrate transporter [Neolentinus lepideus HHB14362 ss-1]